MSRKKIIVLAIALFFLINIWGFLSGNISLKFSRTKRAETEAVVEDSREKIIIEETAAGADDETQQAEQVVYYPTEEALIEEESKGTSNYFIVRGDNTLLFFREEDSDGIKSFYVLAFVIEADGYYYSQDTMRVKNASEQTLQINQGEYYIYFYVEDKDVVEDSLGGEFQRVPAGDGVELLARYIDCPIEEYELYINGVLMDLSDGYNLGDKSSEDIPFYTLEDYISALGLGEKYLLVQGDRTLLIVEESGEGNASDTLRFSFAAAEKINGAYYDRGENVKSGQVLLRRYMIEEVQGEYYMLYLRGAEENTEISDNREGVFQEMEVSNHAVVGAKYIDCPIEEYEFYIDGWRLDLSEAYE